MQELLDHPAGFFAKASISSRNWQAEHCMGIFGLCQRWPKQRQRNDIARLGIQTILDTHTRDITCGETPDLQQILCWLWEETSLAPSNDEGVWLNACAYVYNIYLYIYTYRERESTILVNYLMSAVKFSYMAASEKWGVFIMSFVVGKIMIIQWFWKYTSFKQSHM